MCEPPRHRRDGQVETSLRTVITTVKGRGESAVGHNTTSPGAQPPGRAEGQRHTTRGDNFGGDMANGPSSSSAGWKREPPQTAQSSTGSSPSSSSCAAASGLAPIVRHSPSRVSIFIISAGPALHSGGVGARRGLRDGRPCGEGTSIGSVCGLSVACGSCPRALTEGTCATGTGLAGRGAFFAAQLDPSRIAVCGKWLSIVSKESIASLIEIQPGA
jgi:hypothetical protein